MTSYVIQQYNIYSLLLLRTMSLAKRSVFPFDMLTVDSKSPTPLARQLYDGLRRHIMNGRLPVGTRLPSSRTLAEQLGVGRNTVLATYDQLVAEGYLRAESAAGTWVAYAQPKVADVKAPAIRAPRLSKRGALLADEAQPSRRPKTFNFQPGFPETGTFPYATWSRLLAQSARQHGSDWFGYSDYAGDPGLREVIATYIGVSRGVECEPEQVIVVTGAQAALDLVARVILDDGDPVWMEDPGYLGARGALLGSGARMVPLRVDRDGWQIDDPELPPPRAIFVTPSCQWPLGLTMGATERMHLLEIANRHDSWIIEDDYDGEYRFRGRPVPALYGLDKASRVIYVGTFGKTLFASLRLGFLIVPREFAPVFSRAVSVTGQFAPLLLQATLAEFIRKGHFAAHLKRMRRLYVRRQALLVDLCERHLSPWVTVDPSDAGMQVLATFRCPWDDRKVAAAAFRHGVDVQPISINYRFRTPEQGLLLGFAAMDEKASTAAVAGLKAAFRDLDAEFQSTGSVKQGDSGPQQRGQQR